MLEEKQRLFDSSGYLLERNYYIKGTNEATQLVMIQEYIQVERGRKRRKKRQWKEGGCNKKERKKSYRNCDKLF